jgi:hypothetical protein
VLVARPLPEDVAVPVHFQDQIVQELLVADCAIAHIAVGKDQGFAFQRLGLHAGRVVAHGVAFTLKIVVIAGHPAAGDAGILNKFVLVEFPDNIAVPIHLDNVKAILHTVFAAAGPRLVTR